jgi:2-methylisocitrate lyase-like PEP mutase family enzyme
MSKSQKLRDLIQDDEIIVAPGAYDALSARLIESCGFPVIEATGAGIACALGYPDVGLLTMTEVLWQVERMAAVTSVPVIADADTGYGNAVNVHRTLREFERAGVAGLHIEDQVFPKKCGLLAGKEVVSIGEMVGKIKAAADARNDDDFVIIARTDARESRGLKEVIERGNAFHEAGADMVFVYGAHSFEELQIIAKEIHAPLMTHISKGAKFSSTRVHDLQQMGYRLVIFALAPLEVAAKSVQGFLQQLRQTGTDESYLSQMMSPDELYGLVGLPEVMGVERRYVVS